MRQEQDIGATVFAVDSPHHGYSRSRSSPVTWLNLLCLDAPIVAVTWQWLFARSFDISLTAPPRITLFLTAWCIYLADRFADTLALREEDPKSMRQAFCQNYRREWLGLLFGVGLLDIWLVTRHLDEPTIVVGLLIGLAATGYLATNFWLGRIWWIVPAKEICIGVLFATGTVAALIPRIQINLLFIVSLVFFAALCSLNCISIAVWECELDCAQDKNSIATRFPGAAQYLKMSGLVLTGLCGVTAIMGSVATMLFIFIGISALLLAALDLARSVIARDQRTALADLVLFAPLILLVFGFWK